MDWQTTRELAHAKHLERVAFNHYGAIQVHPIVSSYMGR